MHEQDGCISYIAGDQPALVGIPAAVSLEPITSLFGVLDVTRLLGRCLAALVSAALAFCVCRYACGASRI